MTKAEEIKEKIKALTDSSEKLKREVLSISKKVGELKEELDIEENKEFYERCNKLEGKYIKVEYSTDQYHNSWYVFVEELNVEESDIVQIKGKSVLLIFINNHGKKGSLVTYTYDRDSSYGITKEWMDTYSGYFKFNEIKMSTEEEFQLAKDTIKDLN